MIDGLNSDADKSDDNRPVDSKRFDPENVEKAFSEVTEALAERQKVKRERPAFLFIIFMVALAAGLATLGFWQLARLSEKETLVARVETRMTAPARNLPPVAEWMAFDPEVWDFRRVSLSGKFLHDQTVLVFVNLTESKGAQSGPGYWVLTPFSDDSGGFVWVNRGFIPQSMQALFQDGGSDIDSVQTLTGIARTSERVNAFTPGPDYAHRIDWISNVERLKNFMDPLPKDLAPIIVDLDQIAPELLPQAGETKLELPNRHLEYALTWFSLAGIIPILMAFWIFRRRQD